MESTNLSTILTMPDEEDLDEYEQEEYIIFKKINTVIMVAYSLVFVLGTTGNGLVIFITGFRMKKTVNTVWFLSLAIVDFTFSFFRLFRIVHIGLEFHWPFGDTLCKLNYIIVYFSLVASIYLLVIISIDRCISTWCPVWARNHRTPRMASFAVLGVWILALVLCSINFYLMETYFDDETNTTYCFSDYNMTDVEGVSTLYIMVILRFVFGFISPFIVIVVCYGAIMWRLRRDRLSQSRKPFKVITAVIVAFFVCWFPFHVFYFLKLKAFYEPKMHVVVFIGLHLSYSLAYFSGCLNPILYFFVGHNFKEKLRWSFLSALVNAFTEESNHCNTKAQSSTELDSHNL